MRYVKIVVWVPDAEAPALVERLEDAAQPYNYGVTFTSAPADTALVHLLGQTGDDHEARPDDDPEPGDRCKDCGRDITWTGPSMYDWTHVDDRPLRGDPCPPGEVRLLFTTATPLEQAQGAQMWLIPGVTSFHRVTTCQYRIVARDTTRDRIIAAVAQVCGPALGATAVLDQVGDRVNSLRRGA